MTGSSETLETFDLVVNMGNLTANRNYSFTARTVNSAGNSQDSQSAHAQSAMCGMFQDLKFVLYCQTFLLEVFRKEILSACQPGKNA